MPNEVPTCDWIGKSGTRYTHWIFPLPASFKAGEVGNYVFAKKNSQGQWVPVYIGEGELDERVSNHHQCDCIEINGATHIHCHLNALEESRLAEEDDLLARYTNAYRPTGCNERVGG